MIQNKITEWAIDRNIISPENAPKQLLKLSEEVGELCSAYLKNKDAEIIDAIGDIQVVLIILSKQLGVDYDKCLEIAYEQIKHRTGKTINGIFIKD
jgi:NTP pyrophosphatase (non-canonical NTP hydrolase)